MGATNQSQIEEILAEVAAQRISEEQAYRQIKAILNGANRELASDARQDIAQSGNISGVASNIETYLREQVASILQCRPEEVAVDRPFLDLGANSASLIGVVEKIEKEIGIELYPTIFFEYQNIRELTGYLESEHESRFTAWFHARPVPPVEIPFDSPKSSPILPRSTEDRKCRDIAVIGMAGRFARSRNLREFWAHLRAGTDLITEVPVDHWDYRPWFDAVPQKANKTYCKWGSFLDNIDKFDPLFFNMSPREADFTDPQLRHLLEVLYETVDDAGCGGSIWGSRTGMYVGACFQEYWDEIVRQRVPITGMEWISSAMSSLANRPSFFFDLRGPSITVDDVCSSSLVALHLACKAIQNGECDMAFAAGVNVLLSPLHYVYCSAIGALSPTGHCHTFDASADGYVPGEGIASVLLKPLEQAIRDGDVIHAVIKGSAVNHGGRANNPTSPRTQLQTEVIQSAWRDAGISPDTIGYIEAHGTGTLLGDPVEVEALKKAFRPFTTREGFCALGSVKANIGHTEGAAGIAGVIKAILGMKHGFVPAMPGLRTVNPYLKLEGSPMFLQAQGGDWPQPKEHPRRAGVSSFGMGGAYAHVVVEEFSDTRLSGKAEGPYLFVLSAQTENRLKEYASRFLEFLTGEGTNVSLPDICHTLRTGRQHFDYRLAMVVSGAKQLNDLLERYASGSDTGEWCAGKKAAVQSDINGNQKPRTEAEMRVLAAAWVSGAAVQWNEWQDGKRISLPAYPFEPRRHWIPPTGLEHPETLGGASHALHPLIDGVKPSLNKAVFHKFFKDAERLLAEHSVFEQSVLPGVAHLEMVWAGASLLRPKETTTLREVVWKRPLVVPSDGLSCELEIEETETIQWRVCGGGRDFSSGHLEFGGSGKRSSSIDLAEIKTRLPRRIEATSLYRRFADLRIQYGPFLQSLQQIWTNGREVLAEIRVESPEFRTTRALDAMLQSALALYDENLKPADVCLPFFVESASLTSEIPEVCFAYLKSESTPVSGKEVIIDFLLVGPEGAVVAELKQVTLKPANPVDSGAGLKSEPIRYFHPRWKRESLERHSSSEGPTLIFRHAHDGGFEETLQKSEAKHVFVYLGRKYERITENRFSIDCSSAADFQRIAEEFPDVREVYFLGGLPFPEDLKAIYRCGVFSLLRLVQAFPPERNLVLKVLTQNVGSVTGVEKALRPFGALVAGLARVAAREFRNCNVSCIDLDGFTSGALRLIKEEAELQSAIRNERRYIRVFDEVEFPVERIRANLPLRERGVYLVAGGKGGLGLAFSEYLAREFKARLVLVGLSAPSPEQAVALKHLESLGGEVLYVQADISDSDSMRETVRSARSRFGDINGVIHSALTLADQSLGRMNEESLTSVFHSKVEGTIALEAATRDEALDFVLFFSSANSFVANAGQANYVAACAFQDAFAESLRKTNRCPVFTVNWGLWGEIGIMARQGQIERLATLGIHPIGPEEGIECGVQILENRIPQVIAAKMDAALLTASGLKIEGRVQLLPPGFEGVGKVGEVLHPVEQRAKSNVASWSRSLAALDQFCLERLRENISVKEGSLPITWRPKFGPLWKSISGFLTDAPLAPSSVGIPIDPGFGAHFRLASRCLDSFGEIVSGKLSATEVMFPNSSMELLDPIYAGNPFADFYNELAAEAVGASLREWQAKLKRPLRIIEIGAGTGGTTRVVLGKIGGMMRSGEIGADVVEYHYTDLSDVFLRHGREQFAATYPFVQFRVLDVEREPVEQGRFDIVLAANVLHATRSIQSALKNVKRLLHRNGVLVLNELTAASAFTTVTFGLLDGWWKYDDAHTRIAGTPLLSIEGWRSALREAGFSNPSVFGASNPGTSEFQSLLVAESNGFIKSATSPTPTPIFANSVSKIQITTDAVPLTDLVRNEVALTLRLDALEIDPQKSFSEYGVDSILSVELIGRLNKALDLKLKTTVLFDYSSVHTLAAYLGKLTEGRNDRSPAVPIEKREPPAQAPLSSEMVLGAVISAPGDIDDLEIKPVSVREPSGGEIQIQVRAFSLNFGDWLCVRGLYPSMPDYPFTPGFEVAGEVVKIGDGITRFQVGDEVIALSGPKFGGHAEMITVDERLAVQKPEAISFEEAAAFPVVFLTARQAFERAQVRAGEKVLIQTAAGGTGLMLVQFAQKAGAEIFATAGSAEKLQYLTGLGVQHGINYRETDFAAEVRRINGGRGVDVVFNTLSGEAIQKGLHLLEPNGRYIEIAMTGLKAAQGLDLSDLTKNQSIHSINLFHLLNADLDRVPIYLEEMTRYLSERTIVPTVAKTFAFSELKDAYRELLSRRSIGKIVVNVPERIAKREVSPAQNSSLQKIAIVGMAGKFPGAENIDEFWKNLAEGRSSITEIPAERWPIEGFYDPNPHAPNRSVSKWGGFLKGIDQFDPLFFNISGREAERMDPQQRVFLEQAWCALEHAGYSGESLNDTRCGLFVGTSGGDYFLKLRESSVPNDGYVFTGNHPSILAGRLAYLLNLKGPALAVDTACSSALVAIHLACQSIRSGESDMALAGGVFIQTTPTFHLLCSKAGMLSPTGRCNAFDDRADGFVPGEGAGVIVLKMLSRALADGDQIYGVIVGSGTNQDGKTNGITAPSALSQTSLEGKVYKDCRVNPETISYVETHGTGTKLGDPIEVDALTEAFQKHTGRTGFCALGSVKTNIGHAATAAGVASVIKVLLSFQHEALPPSLNFERENAQLQLGETPFFVNRELAPWSKKAGPRCAAVSSFGFSGTNCHMLLEEPPAGWPSELASRRPAFLFPLSAKSPTALQRKHEQLVHWLEEHSGCLLEEVSFTLCEGRDHFEYRSAFVAKTLEELLEGLRQKKAVGIELSASKLETALDNLRESATAAIYRASLADLAAHYEHGGKIPWRLLFGEGRRPRRLALPLYPFDRQSYWLPSERKSHDSRPLRISGDDWFVKEHVIHGESVLPAAMYLEWARSMVQREGTSSRFVLTNSVWTLPFKINGAPREATIELREDASGKWLSVRSSDGTHFETEVLGPSEAALAPLDLSSIQSRCRKVSDANLIYGLFASRGIAYGNSFQTIRDLSANGTEAIARLVESTGASNGFGWNPGLLDGALQTVVVLVEQLASADGNAFVPYGLERLEVQAPALPPTVVAYARLVDSRENRFRFDIDILDEAGVVLLRLRGLGLCPIPDRHSKMRKAITENEAAPSDLLLKAENFLRSILAEELRVSPQAIRSTDPFEKFGIDSIMVNEFNELLQKNFGTVSKTLFFECRNLRSLAEHFVEHHAARLRELVNGHDAPAQTESASKLQTSFEPALHLTPRPSERENRDEDIAIIGMAGRFPQAANTEEFWGNLRDGRDCISEIPAARWDWTEGFDADPKKEGGVYTKWGGFIEDFDRFDPLFFKISPQEAELMDPQERHFLEIAYSTIEDAGYTPAELRNKCAQARGKDIGVFVGVMWGDYQLYGAEDSHSQSPLPWSAYWSLANRVSYTFDFKGPSLALDTACSSSLTAIHLACESLQRGHCRAALAGGVNLSLHPNKYRHLCQMKFASTDGKCRSFGAGGDGYVPGEGVGAVLLKPLSAAKQDGDHIYGVIKATGWNHGGKTNGYSVPNPVAQGDLIEDVIERSRIPAESISFIEAHGTGTPLGDPIEVTGLTRAFRKFTAKSQFCILGSAKANIGHLEAAAGVAALIKVLLQMKHAKVPPSLHADKLNPNLSLGETPFILQRELAEWARPIRDGVAQPRRAGVSSFGAGGANAHLVVEEYSVEPQAPQNEKPEVIVLSARTEGQLRDKGRQLKRFLDSCPVLDLAQLAFTLQVGREQMDHRLALCVSDREDLGRKLDRFLAGATDEVFLGWARHDSNDDDAEEEAYIHSLFKNGRNEKLAKLWVEGCDIEWSQLYGSGAPARISLPTYPFARERYWIPQAKPKRIQKSDSAETRPPLSDDIFYTTEWVATAPANGNGHATTAIRLLVFDDSSAFAEQWEEKKNGVALEARAITRTTGEPHSNGKHFEIRPGREEDYQWLIARLQEQKFLPTHVVLLWNYREPDRNSNSLTARSETGLLALFYLTKALQSCFYSSSIRMMHVSRSGQPIDIAVSGFARAVARETPNYQIKSVQFEGPSLDHAELGKAVTAEMNGSFAHAEVRCEGLIQFVRKTVQAPKSEAASAISFRRGGVYVITGGLGELGMEFASRLAREFQAKLVLLGRSVLPAEKKKLLEALADEGGQAIYLQADINDREQLGEALKKARTQFGEIRGILHLACVVEDALVYRQSRENFMRVLAPKIFGTELLDDLTKDDALDFFVSFSSAVSVTGNAGQAAYAAACRFQDAFAEHRNHLHLKGQRSGRTLTIAWSQWEKAGHFAPREMLAAAGIKQLSIETGWQALQECFKRGGAFYLVIDGEREKIHRLLNIPSGHGEVVERDSEDLSEAEIDAQLRALMASEDETDSRRIRELLAQETNGSSFESAVEQNRTGETPVLGHIEDAIKNRLKLILQPADRHKPFTDFGIDSINAVKLADDLQKRLGLEVNPKMFWDSPTVETLAVALTERLSKEVRS